MNTSSRMDRSSQGSWPALSSTPSLSKSAMISGERSVCFNIIFYTKIWFFQFTEFCPKSDKNCYPGNQTVRSCGRVWSGRPYWAEKYSKGYQVPGTAFQTGETFFSFYKKYNSNVKMCIFQAASDKDSLLASNLDIPHWSNIFLIICTFVNILPCDFWNSSHLVWFIEVILVKIELDIFI